MKFKTVFCFVAGMLLLTGCSGSSNTKAMAETTTVIESVAEPVYQGNDESKEVEAATTGEVKIEKGANLVAVPNLAFSPDYLKPDAKILQIEKE